MGLTAAAGMRGLVIFDDHTEIVYFHVDKDLEKHVKDRRRSLEIAAGATVSHSIPLDSLWL